MTTSTQPQPTQQPATVIQLPTSLPNNTWVSRVSSTTAFIKFDDMFHFNDSTKWGEYRRDDILYEILMIPNDQMKNLSNIPVINPYVVYAGQTDGGSYGRFYFFKKTLDNMMEKHLRGITGCTANIKNYRHSGAIQFFNGIKNKHTIYYGTFDKEFKGVKDHTLMIRVAKRTKDWEVETFLHEGVLVHELRKAYPGKLFNQI